MGTDSSTWGATYCALVTLSSRERDSPGLHLQTVEDPDGAKKRWFKRSSTTKYVNVTSSDTFPVGQLSQDDVITFDRLES